MIIIKQEKTYPNDSKIYISYFMGCWLGFFNYVTDINRAAKFETVADAKALFTKYQLNLETHKYIVI